MKCSGTRLSYFGDRYRRRRGRGQGLRYRRPRVACGDRRTGQGDARPYATARNRREDRPRAGRSVETGRAGAEIRARDIETN